MTKIIVRDYDVAEFLDNEEVIAGYLSEIFATGTDAEVKRALANVARARNMSEIAKKNESQSPVALQIAFRRYPHGIWNNPQLSERDRCINGSCSSRTGLCGGN